MIRTEIVPPETIGFDSYKELAPGVFQNEAGAVVLHDGDNALKLELRAPPSTKE